MKSPAARKPRNYPQPTLPEQLSLSVATPVRRFGVILADPPWRYAHSKSANRAIENHYPTLDVTEIASIPVRRISTSNTILFLWVTPPKLEEGLHVLRAWGFRYVTDAMWDKVHIGMGHHFRQQHEQLLVGKRGHGTPPPHCRPSSVFRAPRSSVHSRKPDEVYEYIESSYPRREKIELFARTKRPGWHVWGNEVESDVNLPVPAGRRTRQLRLDFA